MSRSWLWLAALAGCAHLVPMTPELVRDEGRMVFTGTPEKVFQAVQEALDSANIGVAVAKPETGLIVSKRFVLAAYPNPRPHVANGKQDTIPYELSVKGEFGSEGEVVVAPRGYHNNME